MRVPTFKPKAFGFDRQPRTANDRASETGTLPARATKPTALPDQPLRVPLGRGTPLAMPLAVFSRTPQVESRAVECYHCKAPVAIPPKAMTLSCPKCFKHIHVEDVVVDRDQLAGQVRTCGVVVVGKRGSLSADLIEARQGVQVLGKLQGRVVSGGPVVIGPKAVWNGDCHATRIVIQPGATILGGRFTIGSAGKPAA